MEDNYIYFELNNRKLKINKNDSDDIYIWRTKMGKWNLNNPYYAQLAVIIIPPSLNKNKTSFRSKHNRKNVKINKKNYKLHRVVYLAFNQTRNIHNSSKNNQIDHIDNNPCNNNIDNLRITTDTENKTNMKHKGYYYHTKRKKYIVQIQKNNKRVACKYCDTREIAHNTYQELKKIHHIIK